MYLLSLSYQRFPLPAEYLDFVFFKLEEQLWNFSIFNLDGNNKPL